MEQSELNNINRGKNPNMAAANEKLMAEFRKSYGERRAYSFTVLQYLGTSLRGQKVYLLESETHQTHKYSISGNYSLEEGNQIRLQVYLRRTAAGYLHFFFSPVPEELVDLGLRLSVIAEGMSITHDYLRDNLKCIGSSLREACTLGIHFEQVGQIFRRMVASVFMQEKEFLSPLAELHRPDREKLYFLVRALMILLDVHSAAQLAHLRLNLYVQTAFSHLCMLLGRLCNKDVRGKLMEKALLFHMTGLHRLNMSKIWGDFHEGEEEYLASSIIDMQLPEMSSPVRIFRNGILEFFQGSTLLIGHLGSEEKIKEFSEFHKPVYTLFDGMVKVASVHKKSWKSSNDIGYYQELWRNLEQENLAQMDISQLTYRNGRSKIRITQVNPDFSNMVFCQQENMGRGGDGVIIRSVTSPQYLYFPLNKVFEKGMCFYAKKEIKEDRGIVFDISKEIIAHSHRVMKHCAEFRNAILVSKTGCHFVVITDNGITCRGVKEKTDMEIGGVYRVKLIKQNCKSGKLPSCSLRERVDEKLDGALLLKGQLQEISDYNQNVSPFHLESPDRNRTQGVLEILDCMSDCQDKFMKRYNFYFALRLAAIAEDSDLQTYYIGCICHMEYLYGFIEQSPYTVFFPDFSWDERVLEAFPKLRFLRRNEQLLEDFGTERLSLTAEDRERIGNEDADKLLLLSRSLELTGNLEECRWVNKSLRKLAVSLLEDGLQTDWL